jgi:hypothetical protein
MPILERATDICAEAEHLRYLCEKVADSREEAVIQARMAGRGNSRLSSTRSFRVTAR